jgi:hypothetical protein
VQKSALLAAKKKSSGTIFHILWTNHHQWRKAV